MDQNLIEAVCEEVYRRFPEIRGKKPKVQKVSSTEELAQKGRSISRAPTYLLIFQSQAVTANQKSLPTLVRVVIDERGKILKISMSH
jgi:hypothetical protein